DFACLLLGAVVVPIYTTLTAEQTAYILRDSGAPIVFVSNGQYLQKVLSIQDQTVVEKIVVMDTVDRTRVSLMSDLMKEGTAENHSQSDAAGRAIQPDDLATIIYTSGTTGTPKGVMLTHGKLALNLTFLPDKLRRRSHGSSPTIWFTPRCGRAWAGGRNFSSPEARLWDANWPSGMPSSGFAFMKAMG